MINPKELRIGNYLYGNHKLQEVVMIDRDGYIVTNCSGYVGRMGYEPLELESFDPIPITEEWLVKLGFEICEEEDCYEISYQTDCHYPDKNYLTIYGLKSGVLNVCISDMHNISYASNYTETLLGEIQHIHQLQNLYFALTREELTLNEH